MPSFYAIRVFSYMCLLTLMKTEPSKLYDSVDVITISSTGIPCNCSNGTLLEECYDIPFIHKQLEHLRVMMNQSYKYSVYLDICKDILYPEIGRYHYIEGICDLVNEKKDEYVIGLITYFIHEIYMTAPNEWISSQVDAINGYKANCGIENWILVIMQRDVPHYEEHLQKFFFDLSYRLNGYWPDFVCLRENSPTSGFLSVKKYCSSISFYFDARWNVIYYLEYINVIRICRRFRLVLFMTNGSFRANTSGNVKDFEILSAARIPRSIFSKDYLYNYAPEQTYHYDITSNQEVVSLTIIHRKPFVYSISRNKVIYLLFLVNRRKEKESSSEALIRLSFNNRYYFRSYDELLSYGTNEALIVCQKLKYSLTFISIPNKYNAKMKLRFL